MGDPFDLAAGWLEEHLLIPVLYQFGLMNWEDVSYGWALFAVYGAVQVAVTFAVCLPLEHWRPVERWPDNKAVLVDVAYTVVSRVGILPFVTYVLFYRAQVSVSGWMTDQGWVPPTLEGLFPVPAGAAGADLRAFTRSSWISPTMSGTGWRTSSAGGGRCTRCTTRSGR